MISSYCRRIFFFPSIITDIEKNKSQEEKLMKDERRPERPQKFIPAYIVIPTCVPESMAEGFMPMTPPPPKPHEMHNDFPEPPKPYDFPEPPHHA